MSENTGQTQEPVPENIASPGQPEGMQSAIEELRGMLETATKDAAMLKDQLLRKAAEFENYKRRTEGEFRMIVENATERLMLDLLPVLDDLDRFLKSSNEEKDIAALRKGVTLISNKMFKILAMRGLTPFESLGKQFDVHYHDALMQITRSDVSPNTVVEEVERGYSLNDRVLRHAKVVVSAPPDGDPQTQPATPAAGTETTENGSPLPPMR